MQRSAIKDRADSAACKATPKKLFGPAPFSEFGKFGNDLRQDDRQENGRQEAKTAKNDIIERGLLGVVDQVIRCGFEEKQDDGGEKNTKQQAFEEFVTAPFF